MKKLFGALVVTVAFMAMATTAMASDNAILASLASDGVVAEQISDADLDKVRGTGFVNGLTMPSYRTGIREYQVTYSGWGSGTDYRSYVVQGYGQSPNQFFQLGTDGNGTRMIGVGDVWLADQKSAPNTWRRANAVTAEIHLEVLGETYYGSNQWARTGWGYTESAWNRPLNKFNW